MKILFLGDSLTQGPLGVSYVERLRGELPDHTLINCGKSGDTVISLYRRIQKIDVSADLIVLWIGVNDVFVKLAWSFRIVKTLAGQPPAKDADRFQDTYRRILAHVTPLADRVIALPPLLIGEDPENRWNRELERLASLCRSASDGFENVEFLDVRRGIIHELRQKQPSDYLPTSIRQIRLDVKTLRNPELIEKTASERGLWVTVDGVHLNASGAEMVADAILETIRTFEKSYPS